MPPFGSAAGKPAAREGIQRPWIAAVLLAAAAAFSIHGCGRDSKDAPAQAAADARSRLPDYVLGEVTHTYYQRGVLKLKVSFARGEYFADKDELAVENCRYLYYDSRGNVLSRGSSEEASLYASGSRLVARREVVVVSEVNGGVLNTEYLEWTGSDNQFTTEEFVTITRTNGDRVSGKGMIADLALRYVTIKRNVKGQFREE